MQKLRLESLDHHEIAAELRRVETELKQLANYRDDLEHQHGTLLRDEDRKTTHTDDPDPGPRQSFIDGTKDMYKTEAERAAKAG